VRDGADGVGFSTAPQLVDGGLQADYQSVVVLMMVICKIVPSL